METSSNKMEVCVFCEKITDVPVNQSIDLREEYVEGAGQLCSECYEIYIMKCL